MVATGGLLLWAADGKPGSKDSAARGARKTAATTRPAGARVFSKSGYDITPLSETRVEDLAKVLTPEQRDILLAKGTERPFCGLLEDHKEKGVYVCRLCGLPLFSSDAKSIPVRGGRFLSPVVSSTSLSAT
jgi:hypothetical protein